MVDPKPIGLPSTAMNWARWVGAEINGLRTAVRRLTENEQNAGRRQSTTMRELTEQIRALNAQRQSFFSEHAVTRTGFSGFDIAAPGPDIVPETTRLRITISGAANGGAVTYTYGIYDQTIDVWLQTREDAIAEGPGIRTLDLSGGASYINSGSRTWVHDGIPIGHTLSVVVISSHQDEYAVSFYKSILVEMLP